MDTMQAQLRKIEKRLDRAARFGTINKKEFRKANRMAGKETVNAMRGKLKPYKDDITIHKKDGKKILVKKNQLKNSIGVWFSKGSNTAMIGPRANNAGKYRLKRKVRDGADGWFAHIVEMGARPATMKKGGKKGGGGIIMQTPNKGKLTQGIKAGIGKTQRRQVELYRQEFKRFMK